MDSRRELGISMKFSVINQKLRHLHDTAFAANGVTGDAGGCPALLDRIAENLSRVECCAVEEKYYENETFENLKLAGEAIASCEFVNCKFINCSFENCKLFKSTLSECVFQKCSIVSLKAEYSQTRFVEFESCNLAGIDWQVLLPAGGISRPISAIQKCRLKYNTFTQVPLARFDFSSSEISDSMFAKCDLLESNFSGCKLNRTEFFECDLRKANFSGAVGYQIDIFKSKLKGAKFSFPEVVNLLGSLGIKID